MDDDSPKPSNTASGLAGLQMLHPIPAAGHELGGVGLGFGPYSYSLNMFKQDFAHGSAVDSLVQEDLKRCSAIRYARVCCTQAHRISPESVASCNIVPRRSINTSMLSVCP